ncbi:hypothetical protein [uncultured Fluviicola sp.]|nr:hypothetical protein [uncultured Fluviicola sp.]
MGTELSNIRIKQGFQHIREMNMVVIGRDWSLPMTNEKEMTK